MALIPALLLGIQAFRKERERLANKGQEGGGSIDFGPGLDLGESNAIQESFTKLGLGTIGAVPQGLPTIQRRKLTLPGYEPPKQNN